MKVLILGSGGREHALGWKIKQSPLLSSLFFAPGNAGTKQIGTNILINPNDFPAIKEIVITHHIDLVVVGPEEPLVNGIVDYFHNDPALKHILIIGPSAKASQLEGSKSFAKKFMKKYGIPTAPHAEFTKYQINDAVQFIKELPPPYVIKADGLAAGKGVVILSSTEEAIQELKEMFHGKFGKASEKVVIEKFLQGVELSVFILTDGKNYVLLPEAKDYKKIGENDTGPNTGGMGAVTPVPFADSLFMQKVTKQIIEPTLYGLQQEQLEYKGFIFFGLMNVQGNPYVIEYNVRMGDPETEAVMPRLKNDLLELVIATLKGTLHHHNAIFHPETFATVIAVSGGYPGEYKKGLEIHGLPEINSNENVIVFHAGTKEENGKILTSGGRVLAFTGKGKNLTEALRQSYTFMKKVHFDGMTYRSDIGKDLL